MRSRELDAAPTLDGSDDELLDAARDARRRPLRRAARAAAAAASRDEEMRARTGIDPWFLRELRARAATERASTGVRTYRAVDTCAAEFEAETPYYYSAWERPPARARGRAAATGRA